MANMGMRLLKKGQKGVVRAVFSRIGLMTVMLLLHFALFFAAFFWLGEQYLPHFYLLESLISVGSILYLVNCSNIDPSAKITWLIVLMLMYQNDYTLKQTFKTIFLTLFCVLVVVALIVVLYMLISQLVDFIVSIYGEVVYRFVKRV